MSNDPDSPDQQNDMNPIEQARCDACGERLHDPDEEAPPDIRVLEVPSHAIDDFRKVDEDIADELLQNDGRLAYHADCTHPIHQYLPDTSEAVRVSDPEVDNPADTLVACPVCQIPVSKSVGECGRCGKTICT